MSPKLMGLSLIIREKHVNKSEARDVYFITAEVVQSDKLKKTKASDPVLGKYIYELSTLPLQPSPSALSHPTRHQNLRPGN